LLEGDPVVVEAVGKILSMNGVGGTPVGRCPYAGVVLSADGDRIRVEITDRDARKSARTVTSAKSAATVVESWLQEDPTALFPRTASDMDDVAPGAVASQPPPPAPVIADVASPAASSGPSPRAYFDLDGVAGVGFDGSGWFGGGLSGCAALGPVCLGAGAKIAGDPRVSGDSAEFKTRRLLLDLVALLDYPVRLRGFTLRPGIDLGAAFARMKGLGVEADGEHENSGDELSGAQRWEFALGAHLVGAISLGKGLALTVGVAIVVLPAADTGTFGDDDASFAGVPRGVVRGSVGLEYAL
jgi:hypothetical protein